MRKFIRVVEMTEIAVEGIPDIVTHTQQTVFKDKSIFIVHSQFISCELRGPFIIVGTVEQRNPFFGVIVFHGRFTGVEKQDKDQK